MRKKISLSLILCLLFLVNCVGLAVAATKNVTQPVMLGPIKNISKDTLSFDNNVKEKFYIEVEDSVSSSQTRYQTRVTIISEGAEKLDAELMKITTSPKELIKVRKVKVGSYNTCILWCSGRMDFVGIDGEVSDEK